MAIKEKVIAIPESILKAINILFDDTNTGLGVSNVQRAIEYIFNLAKGRNRAHVFETTADMQTWLSDEENKGFCALGDNLYIKDLGVPDWWIAEILDTPDTETGYYYKIAQLETQKVDLTEIDAGIEELKEVDSLINAALDEHTSNTSNPHGVTKSQVGLGNVPNVATNDQTPTYTVASEMNALTSGEKLSVAFGKIAKAILTLSNHITNKSNPHGVTKSQVGLGNTENKSSATIRGELTKSNVTTALGYTPLNQAIKGAAGGVAELDENGIVLTSQLPSFVDDVLEYSAKSSFPSTGETGKIYVDTSTNKTYRWSGSTYTEISPSIALGETSSTAYRGDRGKIAYTHSQVTSGNPHGVTKSDVGLGNVPNVTTNNQTPTFTVASTRANIVSGEKLSVIMGKIMKFLTDLGDSAFKGVKNLTAKGSLEYNSSTAQNLVPTISTLAFWNGAYNGTSSNLAYCVKGAFGAAAIKNVDTTPTADSANLVTSGGVKAAIDGLHLRQSVDIVAYRCACIAIGDGTNTNLFLPGVYVADTGTNLTISDEIDFNVSYDKGYTITVGSTLTATQFDTGVMIFCKGLTFNGISAAVLKSSFTISA